MTDGEQALRYRNYAEELRIIAADRTVEETKQALLKCATLYDQMAQRKEKDNDIHPQKA